MSKLMKYEWRKSAFSKLILLAFTVIAEVCYLIGVFSEKDSWLSGSVAALMCCAVVGIIYIGVESMLTFSKDLNTKQSYMLFLTPRTSYQILGAKVLTNAVSLFAAGLFFSVLAIVDVGVGILYMDGVEQFLSVLEMVMKVEIEWEEVARVGVMGFSAMLVSWLMTIVTGYLAILLSATVLAGKKASGFVSFVIFLVISWATSWVMNKVPDLFEIRQAMVQLWVVVGVAAVLTALLYLITGWLMEKKLSV